MWRIASPLAKIEISLMTYTLKESEYRFAVCFFMKVLPLKSETHPKQRAFEFHVLY
jgi:hypothetical protein